MPLSSKSRLRLTCESYDWGRRTLGKHEAQQWVRQLRTAVSEQLAVVPKAFPLAPEDHEFSEEIRQMVVARYRILFTIKSREVHVLHVRGAFSGGNLVGAQDSL